MNDLADPLYEKVLVLRCQAGDEVAFAEIVARYQARLHYYLDKMLHDRQRVEDVLQAMWWDVFRGLPRLNDVGAFRGWLYRIARDHAVRELRRRRIAFQSLPEVMDEGEPTDTTSLDR